MTAAPGTSGREAWLAELAGQRESLLQGCWAHQVWARRDLRTVEGEPLTVEFPGWLNRGPGPDFTEARLQVGDTACFGDVEVHMAEGDWARHGHHRDRAYDRVVLHVVLRRAPAAPARAPGARAVPVFDAGPYLSPRVLEAMGDPEDMLRRYQALPGRCGLRAALAGPAALNAVIERAAEARARQKAGRLEPLWEGGADEGQILYEQVFRALGYRPYADAFAELARRFPLQAVLPLLQPPRETARRRVLARWFGAAGLLEREPERFGAAEWAAEWRALRKEWEAAGVPGLAQPVRRRGSRPWNAPERRLAGMFHHLYGVAGEGWLKTWLGFLVELDGLRHHPDFRRRAVQRLEAIIDSPAEEPWSRRVSFRAAPQANAARLIGRDRIVVLMANAVIPFFLAYARRRGDTALEKLLYRLFIVLPPEGPNARTRFMEQRINLLAGLPRTLRTHQGLIQIHQDFCTSFDEGCQNCHFPDLIAPRPGSLPR